MNDSAYPFRVRGPQHIGDIVSRSDFERYLDMRERQEGLFAKAGGQYPALWDAIRQLYRMYQPWIDERNYCPYIVDWVPLMTPIERDMWAAIRFFGLKMYPQYPIARFFCDFADPLLRIAIECDGRAYHDFWKDADRDAELATLGWKVYRIPGWRCALDDRDPRSCMGLAWRIACEHHGYRLPFDPEATCE